MELNLLPRRAAKMPGAADVCPGLREECQQKTMLIQLDFPGTSSGLCSRQQPAKSEEFLCQPQHQVGHVDAHGFQRDDLGLGGEWMSL